MAKKPTNDQQRAKVRLRTARSKPVPQRDITARGGGSRSHSKRKRGSANPSA